MRHEEKFLCSKKELFLIESRIKNFLDLDSNQTGNSYNVRSIYFDTSDDSMLKESLDGLNHRNKFRIRTYGNSDDSIIRLEKKTSIGQLKSKTSCILTKEYVSSILQDPIFNSVSEHKKSPLDEFYILKKTKQLTPKVIVNYERSAYVKNDGNIRITFDRNIGASTQIPEFFNETLLTHEILPSHLGLIEIKYDGIFPGYLSRLLNLSNLQRISFSKYGLCRNILEHNGRIDEYYEF